MKKALIITGSILAFIFAVLLIVPFAMRGKIDTLVKQQANEMLTAKLDYSRLGISLIRHFPNASVSLSGLQLGGIDRFKGDTIVAADRIEVVVNLMSIFKDSGIEVNKIILNRPSIYGHVLPDGKASWDIVKPDTTQVAEEDTTKSNFAFKLRDLRIKDASLRYLNEQSNMECSTAPLNLELKGDLSSGKSDLDLEMLAEKVLFRNGGQTFAKNLNAGLKTEIKADLDSNIYELDDATLTVNAIKIGLDGRVQLIGDTTDVDLKADCEKVSFKDVLSLVPAFYTNDFKNLNVTGTLSLGAWAKGPMYGDHLPAFGLTLGVADGTFKYASLPKSVTGINIDLAASNPGGTLDATYIDLKRLTLAMAGNSLAAKLKLRTPISNPDFDGEVHGRVNLGLIREVYPLPDTIKLKGIVTADVKAKGTMAQVEKQQYESMQASGKIGLQGITANVKSLPEVNISNASASITPKTLALTQFNATSGASDIALNGSVSNYLGWYFKNKTLGGTLNLRSKCLDLNQLMSLSNSSQETKEEPADTTGFQIPENLDLAMNASVGKILLKQMILENLTGNVTVKNAAATLSGLSMKAFDGLLNVSGNYSTAKPSAPTAALDMNFKNASFATTFKQLEMIRKIVPIFEKTGGDYSMALKLNTGLTRALDVVWPTLNAEGELRTSNINIQNVGVFDALATALKKDELRTWQIKDALIIKFTVKDGRVITKPFDVKLGNTKLTLGGTTGIDQTIDYTAKVGLPSNGVLNNVNVKIGGTFKSPKVSLDMKDALNSAAEKVLGTSVKEAVNNAKEEVKAKATEAIDAQVAQIRSEAEAAGDKLIAEAQKQKDALVEKAGNPIAKIAAEAAGNKLIDAAKKQKQKMLDQADAKIADLKAQSQK